MSLQFPPNIDAAERLLYIAENLNNAFLSVFVALANPTIPIGRSWSGLVLTDPLNATWDDSGNLTSEPALYGADTLILDSGTQVLASGDTTNFGFLLAMSLEITNEAGTQVLVLGNAVTTDPAPGQNSAGITAVGMDSSARAGSDLVYDTVTGRVTTTAGGLFVVRCRYSVAYNN